MFLPFFMSFFFAVLLAPLVIRQLKAFQFGQAIREDGPASHQKKAGTPTLGGLIFLLPTLVSSLLLLNVSAEIAFLLLLTVGYGTIGFLDDFLKIRRKRNLGLSAMQKLALQVLLAGGAFWLLLKTGIDSSVHIPMTPYTIELGWGYFLFFLFLSVGTTNATNLTDGLDGLLTGLAIIAIGAFAVISYALNQYALFVFSLAFVGALLAFLVYNANPARVFMGDTGSLAIGGALVGIAVLTKTEVLLAIIGFVFVTETLSVIIQVVSYKTRKKRVFPMTPIHHSFEQVGWTEPAVVTLFWVAGAISAMVGLGLFFT